MRALVAVLLLLPALAAADPPAPSVRTLGNQLRTTRAKKAVVRREIRRTRAAAADTRTDLLRFDQRLDRVESELRDTRRDLASSQERLKIADGDLRASETRLAATRRQVSQRLKTLYLQGDGNFLSVIAGTKSVSDLLARQDLMRSIARQDRELFERCVAETREMEARRARRESAVASVRALSAAQSRSKARLAVAREEKSLALKRLKARHADLVAALAEYEGDENEIAASIARYLARQRAARRDPKTPVFRPGRGGWIRPISAPITSGFGMRYHPILHVTRLHAGVDFGAGVGTPIRAVADAIVVSVGYGRGYGNRVVLDHGGGTLSLYAHCSAVYVGAGQRVRRGDRIAAVGSTGLSTGPHLHFEVWQDGRKVNPMTRL